MLHTDFETTRRVLYLCLFKHVPCEGKWRAKGLELAGSRLVKHSELSPVHPFVGDEYLTP